MTRLRILHISDLHFHSSNDTDTDIVATALAKDLERLKSDLGGNCDAVLFSGDLVFSGCSQNDFDECLQSVLMPIASAAGASSDRIFVAPGNHDICREKVRAFSALQDGLVSQLGNTEATNHFIDNLVQGLPQERIAVERLEPFNSFLTQRLPHHSLDHPLCGIGRFGLGDKSIGIALLNSAWRASGEADDIDRGRLLVGERQVDYALKQLAGCDFTVAIVHHPFDWLAPFDRSSVEPLMLGGFHLICNGHLHEANPKFVTTTSGACVISQCGSLYGGRAWYNGYQIIDVDLLSGEFNFHLREYNDRNRSFGPATAIADHGKFKVQSPRSVSTDAKGQIELFLRQYRNSLREKAKEHIHFVDLSQEYSDRVLDEFVCPPLYEREVPDPAIDNRQTIERAEISVNDLLDSQQNFVIMGERKTGRTSLAFHLALEMASGRTKPSIPVFIDIRTYKFNYFELRKAVLNFYGPQPLGFELEKSFSNGLYTFIVDNFDVYDETLLRRFADHIQKFDKCRWIAIASPALEGVVRDRLITEWLPDFRKIHIGSLPRKSIRKMARCWAEEEALDQKDIFEAVINQLNRDGLPKTPYMVALILWALKQRKAGERLNEALLLRNVIDHLLGKADFSLTARGAFNPTAKELTLQEIAWVLRDSGGFMEENDLVAHLVEFFRRKRLGFSAADVMTKLVASGLLSNSDGIIGFKYKTFQEYFVALRLQSDKKDLDAAITDLDFLKFRRELELLSGLRQKNDDIIEVITSILRSRVPERFVKCDATEIDRFTRKGIGAGTTKAKLNEIRRTRLSDDQLDQIMDEADKRAVARGERPVSDSLHEAEGDAYKAALAREAEAIDADSASVGEPLRPGTHMASIDLLARVVRNSDFTDFDIKGPAVGLVLKSWTKILILMLEEVREILSALKDDDGQPIDKTELEIMNYLVARVLMAIVGQTVVTQMSSPTIADTVASVIDDCDPCTGEQLLGLFMLEDANSQNWQKRWRDKIQDKESSGFVVDSFVDRLWLIVNRRALDANQSKRVNYIVDAIETKLELRKEEKSFVLQSIRTATNLKRLEDSNPDGD